MPGEPEVEIVADARCALGESPLWDGDERCLYWVDIRPGRVLRFVPGRAEHGVVFESREAIGALTIQEDGSLLLFQEGAAVRAPRAGGGEGEARTVVGPRADEAGLRFNDVIADPRGRVFGGTMPLAPGGAGRLYRLETGEPPRLTRLLEGVMGSNGLAFSPDRRWLYYTLTRERRIVRFAYDEGSGAIEDRHVLIQVPDGTAEGIPDGLTVDADGCLWSARFYGGCVVRYDPDGQEMARYAVPARRTTSLTFGGANYDELYVTSAGGDVADEAEVGPSAGALFRLRIAGVRGVPELRSRISVPG